MMPLLDSKDKYFALSLIKEDNLHMNLVANTLLSL